jgi:glycosyltransferase involved in cell wall biosynthesis
MGLTPARLCGIQESSGDFIVFVDDDNILAPDFLQEAKAVWNQYPHLGVLGAGTLVPEFEVDPTPEIVPLLPRLALRSVTSPLWSNNPRDSECIPWGAGLAVTRCIANSYREIVRCTRVSSFLDRRGQQLYCGGDDLFSWAAAMSGQGFGLFPRLRVTHLIAAGRLERPYLLRLIRDTEY